MAHKKNSGHSPAAGSCCKLFLLSNRELVEATAIGNLPLDGNSGIAIQPAKGKS
jgi:hypothetical protein